MLLPLRTILWGRPYGTKLLWVHLDGYAAYQRGKITGCRRCDNQLRARRAKIKSGGLGVNGTNGSTWKSIDFNAFQNCQPWLFKKKEVTLWLFVMTHRQKPTQAQSCDWLGCLWVAFVLLTLYINSTPNTNMQSKWRRLWVWFNRLHHIYLKKQWIQ